MESAHKYNNRSVLVFPYTQALKAKECVFSPQENLIAKSIYCTSSDISTRMFNIAEEKGF
jgi:hypothetical protein